MHHYNSKDGKGVEKFGSEYLKVYQTINCVILAYNSSGLIGLWI